jgi:hypothetical protein
MATGNNETTATSHAAKGRLAMTMPSDVPCRYQIVFRTECAEALAGVLGDAVIEERAGYTCVVACVRDQSEFYGLLDRFADLSLRPVSLVELPPSHVPTGWGL